MDLEVVREPFEVVDEEDDDDDNHHSAALLHQPKFDEESRVREAADPCDGLRSPKRETYSDDEDDDARSYVTNADDIDFARSFGIQLKTKKIQSAYERLINSNQFQEAQPNQPDKSGPSIKTSITSDCIYHKGTFYQKGDIVALCDQDDGQIYFAQLTGFLQDQYCEKSASINWLVPQRPTSRRFFDPSAYQIGMEDPRLRKLDCMTFVQHCPHDYYLKKFFQQPSTSSAEGANKAHQVTTHYPVTETERKISAKRQPPYIWTTMETCEVPTIKTNM